MSCVNEILLFKRKDLSHNQDLWGTAPKFLKVHMWTEQHLLTKISTDYSRSHNKKTVLEVINLRDVQRKMVVNNVDRSSLRAP